MKQSEYLGLRAEIARELHAYFKEVSMPKGHFDWLECIDYVKRKLNVKDYDVLFCIVLEYGLYCYELAEKTYKKDSELEKIQAAIDKKK